MANFIKGNSHSTLIFLIAVLAQAGCSKLPKEETASSGDWYNEQKSLYYGIPVRVSFRPENQTLAKRAWNYLEGINDIFNDYKDDSEISLINNDPKKGTFDLSPQLANAFRTALEGYRITGGAFDITIGPLRDLWKKAEKENRKPTPKENASKKRSCGLDKVSLSGNHLTVTLPDLKFDFGGIIKGIAVDHVIAMLKENGAQAAMVQVGGETAVFGHSIREKPHVIGIQDPGELTQIWTAVTDQGQGLSISTSGNYHNPITIEGKEFYHIIDPRTGNPVSTQIISVSIVFSGLGKNWLADALATACAVIGPEKGISMIEDLGGEGLILTRLDKKIYEAKSTGWDTLVR